MEPLICAALVERHIHDLLDREHVRMTPSGLMRSVQTAFPESTRKQVRAIISDMVQAGRLIYAQHYGTTHLELSRFGGQRVSERIMIHSGQGSVPLPSAGVVVRLVGGAAFGCGDHPTTRLALRGLDFALAQMSLRQSLKASRALDIGTGTGVLAIATALLGIPHVLGIDTDPVACHEATASVGASGVGHQVSIFCGALADIAAGGFDIVLANLRPPTLASLASGMSKCTNADGLWILSGFRTQERPALESRLPRTANALWSAEDRTWEASVYSICSQRRPCANIGRE